MSKANYIIGTCYLLNDYTRLKESISFTAYGCLTIKEALTAYANPTKSKEIG